MLRGGYLEPPQPEDDYKPRLQTDLRVVEEAIEAAVAIFPERPKSLPDQTSGEAGIERPPEKHVMWDSNLISVGGPRFNHFAAYFLKEGGSFPFRFVPDQPSDPHNYVIEHQERGTVYEPEIYSSGGDQVYNRDYGMVVKGPTSVEDLQGTGRQVLVLSGCHSAGTRTAFYVLNDVESLSRIFDEAGNRPFQAIVDVSRSPEGQNILGIPSILELSVL